MPEPAQNREVRRFLTFQSAGQAYALPADEVAEIILLPPVTRLPQSPAALLGMANFRGVAVAVASLRALLGQATAPTQARAILLGGAAPVALSIDHVAALVSIPAGRVETNHTDLAAHPGEHLRGAFQPEGGEVTKILDIQHLLTQAFAAVKATPRHTTARTGTRAAPAESTQTEQLLVSFEIAGQDFALPMHEVQEIIPLPPVIAQVPRAETLLLGMVNFRDRLLPVLSLRGLLGFPVPQIHSAQAKIIVTSIAGQPVGLVADRACATIEPTPGSIQPAPAMLAARMGGESRIHAIHRDAASGKITSILATGGLFGADIMARLTQTSAQTSAQSTAPAKPGANHATQQFLVFRLGRDEFALPIAAVDEVAAAPEKITRLPKTPKFLEGVINLRGEVLPVIDQRRRFDMPAYDGPAGRQRLVVTRSQRHRAGLRVDAISGVLSAAENEIEPAPRLSGEDTSLVTGVLNLPASSPQSAGRMILLLNPDELLNRAERGLLDNFSPAQKPLSPKQGT
jgi:purine-binding chemotaxis protein CheW